MVSQPPSLTISILVPVMLPIVVEIASVARSVSLFDYLDGEAEEFQRGKIERRVENAVTYLPFFETGTKLPTFGHWGILHALNSTILLYGVAVVGFGLNGTAEMVLAIAVLIVLVIIPYLEIRSSKRSEIRGSHQGLRGIERFQCSSLVHSPRFSVRPLQKESHWSSYYLSAPL